MGTQLLGFALVTQTIDSFPNNSVGSYFSFTLFNLHITETDSWSSSWSLGGVGNQASDLVILVCFGMIASVIMGTLQVY